VRDAYRAGVAAAKEHNTLPNLQRCEGVDVLTGKQCTRRQFYSIDSSPRCTKCYQAAKGEEAYKTLLRERYEATLLRERHEVPLCVGISKKGMACKYRVCEKGGIRKALRNTGVTSSEAREAVRTEPSITRIVDAYTKSRP
jgi:hypothetical protein